MRHDHTTSADAREVIKRPPQPHVLLTLQAYSQTTIPQCRSSWKNALRSLNFSPKWRFAVSPAVLGMVSRAARSRDHYGTGKHCHFEQRTRRQNILLSDTPAYECRLTVALTRFRWPRHAFSTSSGCPKVNETGGPVSVPWPSPPRSTPGSPKISALPDLWLHSISQDYDFRLPSNRWLRRNFHLS